MNSKNSFFALMLTISHSAIASNGIHEEMDKDNKKRMETIQNIVEMRNEQIEIHERISKFFHGLTHNVRTLTRNLFQQNESENAGPISPLNMDNIDSTLLVTPQAHINSDEAFENHSLQILKPKVPFTALMIKTAYNAPGATPFEILNQKTPMLQDTPQSPTTPIRFIKALFNAN